MATAHTLVATEASTNYLYHIHSEREPHCLDSVSDFVEHGETINLGTTLSGCHATKKHRAVALTVVACILAALLAMK